MKILDIKLDTEQDALMSYFFMTAKMLFPQDLLQQAEYLCVYMAKFSHWPKANKRFLALGGVKNLVKCRALGEFHKMLQKPNKDWLTIIKIILLLYNMQKSQTPDISINKAAYLIHFEAKEKKSKYFITAESGIRSCWAKYKSVAHLIYAWYYVYNQWLDFLEAGANQNFTLFFLNHFDVFITAAKKVQHLLLSLPRAQSSKSFIEEKEIYFISDKQAEKYHKDFGYDMEIIFTGLDIDNKKMLENYEVGY